MPHDFSPMSCKCSHLAFLFYYKTMKRGKWFRCSQPWLFDILESQKQCLLNIRVRSKVSYLEYSVIVRNARKLVIVFRFVSNHSTWSIGFSAAFTREQALVIATPVLQAIRTILEIFVANLKAKKMKRCVPLRRNVAEKPRWMRLKFVLFQLRTCTHESENSFVFFKSLRFYGEQGSVESNPVKLGGGLGASQF